MLNINPQDVNRLRELLASGQITEADLSGMQIQGGSGFNAQMGQGGGVTAARPKVRVVGFGNGQATDLGEEDMRALPVDYTRPGIEIPGIGKGRYTADGRYAVVDNPDGSRTKVVLGYDAAASDRRNVRDMQLRKMAAETSEAEAKAGLMSQRTMLAAGPGTMNDGRQMLGQRQLEDMYGKPDKGFRWSQDGKLEPLPGGEVQEQSQIGIDKASDAMRLLDKMVGQRDATGKPVGDAKPHPGFEAAVGAGFGKTFGAQSDYFPFATEGRDFRKLLEQSKGGAFLEAFQTLKGGGQITEREGEKATAAITRMDAAQSEAEFISAAMEFREVLNRGLARAKTRMGGQPARPQANGPADTARLRFEAEQAIRRGADPAQVQQRLREMGVQ